MRHLHQCPPNVRNHWKRGSLEALLSRLTGGTLKVPLLIETNHFSALPAITLPRVTEVSLGFQNKGSGRLALTHLLLHQNWSNFSSIGEKGEELTRTFQIPDLTREMEQAKREKTGQQTKGQTDLLAWIKLQDFTTCYQIVTKLISSIS